MRRPSRQRGIALITALLVVSLAVIAATAVVVAGNIAIHRAATLAETERASWYAIGVEAWVKTILQRDFEDNPKVDGLTDDWARPVDYLPVDEGFLRGQIVDLQGRFNLNNFATADPEKLKNYTEQFERLLASIEGIDPSAARLLSQTIHDWIDADQEPLPPDGAEDDFYLTLDPPYRTANRPMQSVTELLAVKGVTRELYQKLLPYITVLPQVDTTINANTAPELLLRALVENPGPDFDLFLRKRVEEPVSQVPEDVQAGAAKGSFDVKSSYFLLQAEATIGNSRVALYSLYYRPPQGAPVVLAHSTDTE